MLFFSFGLCLAGLFSACRGCVRQNEEPYSPIEGDTIDVIIQGCERKTVGEAIEETFGKGKPQDSAHRELRGVIERKYKVMGDSLQGKILRGEKIH